MALLKLELIANITLVRWSMKLHYLNQRPPNKTGNETFAVIFEVFILRVNLAQDLILMYTRLVTAGRFFVDNMPYICTLENNELQTNE